MSLTRAYERIAAESPIAALRASGPLSYAQLVESLGLVVEVEGHARDYQGESWYVLRDAETGAWGSLSYGWGCCPGCDALQACREDHEVEALRLGLWDSIRWHAGRKAMAAWWENEPWPLHFMWHARDFWAFWRDACRVLGLDAKSLWLKNGGSDVWRERRRRQSHSQAP